MFCIDSFLSNTILKVFTKSFLIMEMFLSDDEIDNDDYLENNCLEINDDDSNEKENEKEHEKEKKRQNRILNDNKLTFQWIKYATNIYKQKRKSNEINSIHIIKPNPYTLSGKLEYDNGNKVELNDPDLWTLPKICFYDPAKQYKGFDFPNCRHDNCNKKTTITRYHNKNINEQIKNENKSNKKYPRFVYSLDGGIELIGVSYGCKVQNHNGQQYSLSEDDYNERFLNHFITHSNIILTRRYAFTKNIEELLLNLLSEGLGIATFDKILRKRLYENYLKRKTEYIDCCKRNNVPIKTFPKPSDAINHTHNHLWTNIILNYFKKNKDYFQFALSCLKHNGTISIDHTFKICKKITVKIKNTKKRYQLSGACYTVLSNNVPVGIRFTDTKSHENIRSLHTFLQKQAPVKLVLTDQCCSDRNFLKEIHGHDVLVKLDIWHAYQRIAESIPTRLAYRQAALNELRLVLYIDGDRHNKQTESTPIIRANFLSWEQKYKHLNSKLFTSNNYIDERKWILRHINHGCLSLSYHH